MKRFLIAASCLFAAAIAQQSAPQKDNSVVTIQGKVLQEPGGQPIRKASVQFVARPPDGQPNGQHSDTTDEEGRFKVEDLKPGRYVATIQHPGFVQSARGKRASILLQSGQGTADVVFYMQPAAVITGKVTDLDGDPMSNVSVSAVRVGSARRGRIFHDSGHAATNDLGEFRISDLRAGKYIISANPPQGSMARHLEGKDKAKENLIYATTYYPGTLEEEQALALEVHPGDEAPASFGVLASPAYRVSGTVGAVPSNATLSEVLLFSKDRGIAENQQLRKDGSFEFLNVLPGSYTAELMFVSGFSEGKPAMERMRVAEPIKVGTSNVEGLQLQASPDGSVRGKFRLDTGQKFDWTQLNVVLIPAQQDESGVVVGGEFGGPAMSGVNKDGSFELEKGVRRQISTGGRSPIEQSQ